MYLYRSVVYYFLLLLYPIVWIYPVVWIYHINLSIHLWMDSFLSRFCLGSWYTCIHISVVYITRSEITGSYGVCSLALSVSIKQFSKVILPIYLQPAKCRSSSYSKSLPALGIASPFNFNYSGSSLVISHWGFHLHFLMNNNIEHLFIY